jgi:hypothetical protein
MINHYDRGKVAGSFDGVVHPRDMTYQHGDQNTEADRPRTGLKYLTERSAAGSRHGRGHESLQRTPSLLVREGRTIGADECSD